MQVLKDTGKTTLRSLRMGWKVWRLGDYRRWLEWRISDLSAFYLANGVHGEVPLVREFDHEAARWAMRQDPPLVCYQDSTRRSIRLVD